jgi:multidrug efflux system outer membrane protein
MRSRLAILAVSAGLVALLAGCAVGPSYQAPRTAAEGEFDGRSLVAPATGSVNTRWWRLFNDPLLEQLVDHALLANQGLAAADARLREARAARRSQFFDFLPVITGSASGSSERQSAGGTPGGFPVTRGYDLFDAGFDARWELDVFGRTRRLDQAARADSDAALAARQGVQLSVVAEVARNYFELRGAQEQLAVARRNAGNQSSALDLVRARETAGRGTALDTARAEAQVAITLASVPPLEATVSRAMHRIEVLSGRAPGSLAAQLLADAPQPALPESIAFGNAAELLRRRPDIRVAERQLAASTARAGVAVADLFPRVSLSAALGLRALSFNALGDAGNDRRSAGASLTWGLFDIGHLSQQLKVTDARARAQLADYQQTVLLALEETENALSDYGRERRRLAYLAQASRASAQAAELATQRFEGGVSDFLTALDAYRSELDAEDQLAASRTKAATQLVALFKALGGGWEPDATP